MFFLIWLVLHQIIFCVFVFRNPSWYQKNYSPSSYLSANNSLLVRYKVYSSGPRECLCSTWRYAGAYENFIIDPALTHLTSLIKWLSGRLWTKWFWVRAQLQSLKNKIIIWNFQSLTLGENYTEIKAWQLKFPYKNLVRNVFKES